MTKSQLRLLTLFVIYLMAFPPAVFAYNVVIDVSQGSNVNYSYPAVLGDDDKKEEEKKDEKKEDKKEDPKSEVKPEQKPEVKKTENQPEAKPSRVEPRPVKIEIKKTEDTPKVKLINRNKSVQELSPEKVEIKLPSAPKNLEIELEKNNKEEVKREVTGTEDRNSEADSDSATKALRERSERKFEKVEIQSEVHDDGSIELQLESRNIKAKVKTEQLDVDVPNNSIGLTKQTGEGVELIHLPDQAMQKFIDRGLSTVPDTLEVGQSGDSFEYSVYATKSEKLFGFIPRQTKYKMVMDDQNGDVTEQKVSANFVEQVLNLFSF